MSCSHSRVLLSARATIIGKITSEKNSHCVQFDKFSTREIKLERNRLFEKNFQPGNRCRCTIDKFPNDIQFMPNLRENSELSRRLVSTKGKKMKDSYSLIMQLFAHLVVQGTKKMKVSRKMYEFSITPLETRYDDIFRRYV